MQYRHSIAVVILGLLTALPSAEARPQAPSSTTVPPTAPPIDVARLQNLGTFVGFMNLASGTVRLVVIATPSSPSCQPVLDAVAQVLQGNPSKRLRAYVVLTPRGPDDSELYRALNAASKFRERRLVYLIDTQAVVAAAFAKVVSSPDPATGVCFLYDTDARLALEIPAPSLWMSANPQVKGAALDAKLLGERANQMVRRVEQMASQPAGGMK